MSVVFESRLYDKMKNGLCEPDLFNSSSNKLPPDDFVLCRDNVGNPTAIYGDNIWSFNPYRLTAKPISAIRFDCLLVGENLEWRKQLVDEAKYILFCTIYCVSTGRAGSLSAGTLLNHAQLLFKAARFCLSCESIPMIGMISLSELLSNNHYLNLFIHMEKLSESYKHTLNALLYKIKVIGKDRLGFIPPSMSHIKRDKSYQHPIIPTRLYLEYINRFTDDLDVIEKSLGGIESFLSKFKHPCYGLGYSTQSTTIKHWPKSKWLPDMNLAIEQHGLNSLFVGDFKVANRKSLAVAISKIQYRMKMMLHLYTGMRDEEVNRMQYDCLSDEIISEPIVDDEGNIALPVRMIKLISTTTKFSGYKKTSSWYAPSDVVRVVDILRSIVRGLAHVYDVEPSECSLFLSPTKLSSRGKKPIVSSFKSNAKPCWLSDMTITQEDYKILQVSDPSRDFHAEKEFDIGQPWPLTSHQFRRSLAFYAASSGFVSLPTLKRQFKHLAKEMTKYYSRNFERIKTIFGYYDQKTGEYRLSSDHIAFEYQVAQPMQVAMLLINDVLGSDEYLFGKAGSYIEKQRANLSDGYSDVLVKEYRNDTIKRVNNGEIYYRNTLLGGCVNVNGCDCSMLGEYTKCLNGDCAIIKESKLDEQIADLRRELKNYASDTGEFSVVNSELDALLKFKLHRIQRGHDPQEG